MDKQITADLILGTYEHDLFKPFWLPNRDHALLGYEFQRKVKNASAVRSAAVLFHSFGNRNQFNGNINRCREDGIAPELLPKALLVARHLDVIASASYSMLEDYTEYEKWPGAVQNSFSRLPIRQIGSWLTLPLDGTRPSGGDFAEQVFRMQLIASFANQATLDEFAVATAAGGSNFIERSKKTLAVMLPLMANLKPAQVDLIATAYSIFAERTYPAPNDTTLVTHTRLAANLYHVLLGNLGNAPELEGIGLAAISDAQFLAWNQAISVRTLLESSVVTIRLTGIEERFLSAVRLDDLQGAKLLADRVRYALKGRICGDLFGFASLQTLQSCDGQTLADLLCLSEDRFSLTYLVPAACGDEAQLLQRLYALYQLSLEDVVDHDGPPIAAEKGEGKATTAPLLVYLTADIRRTLNDAGVTDPAIQAALMPSRAELLAGLQVILPAIGLTPVTIVAPADGVIKPETIGRALVAAYQGAREQAGGGQTPTAAAAALITAMAAVENDDMVMCSASAASPAWSALSDYAYGRNNKPTIALLQQYFHDFRSEQEELSQATVALRAMAQGVAEAPLLKQFVATTAFPDARGNYRLTYQGANVGERRLALPPFLEHRSEIKRGDGLVDLNAAYVRVRRDATSASDPLIRFPSVSYGADGMGNVAMITLRPTSVLYEDQHFAGAFVERVVEGASDWAGLQAHADLRTYYLNGDAAVDAALREELRTIPAHLARVLQRQQTVTTFFDRLPLRWEAAGIRVLTLEERFPVGRYLIPADQLTEALDVLDLALCLDLLAVHGNDLGLDDRLVMTEIAKVSVRKGDPTAEQRARRQLLRGFLAAYVPKLLVGTTLLFKQKQALYLMLRAEQRLHHLVATQPVLAMGLADMRGTLIDRGQIQGLFDFGQWDAILAATKQLDRRSLDGLAQDRLRAEHLGESEAMAAWVQDRWINRLSGADIKKRAPKVLWPMGSGDETAKAQAQVVHFLLRASRG